MTRVPFAGALMEKAPLTSDEVPLVALPFTTTEAKGTPSPVYASLTEPDTVLFCAKVPTARSENRTLRKSFAFFISIYLN